MTQQITAQAQDSVQQVVKRVVRTFRHPSEIQAERTTGQRVADIVAATMGSWRFIIIQSCVLAVWLALNILVIIKHWDPYPFILLNLMLSFQAAYAAPIIMMSQNRAAAIDRAHAENGYNHTDEILRLQREQMLLLGKHDEHLNTISSNLSKRMEGQPAGDDDDSQQAGD